MASLQILRASALLSDVWVCRSDFTGKANSSRRVFRRHYARKRFRLCCAAQNGDDQPKGEEPPESLFMKELKRRGMTPTSLLEDYEVDDETRAGREARATSRTSTASGEFDQRLLNQRERSMALNSEGLEGLVPRAKLLLGIGGTFFLGFWPLIVLTVAFFSALYLYFGADFVHDGRTTPISPRQYVDPYALLEDERISQITHRVN